MRQQGGQRQVRGAVAVARLAAERDALQRRIVVAVSIGLTIEALILAAIRFLG